MASRENPASGLVVKVSQLAEKLLVHEQRQKLEQHLGSNNHDGIESVLDGELARRGLPTTESVFLVDEDYTSDELEESEWYASFEETDLCKPRELTSAGKLLADLGIEPEALVWTVWG